MLCECLYASLKGFMSIYVPLVGSVFKVLMCLFHSFWGDQWTISVPKPYILCVVDNTKGDETNGLLLSLFNGKGTFGLYLAAHFYMAFMVFLQALDVIVADQTTCLQSELFVAHRFLPRGSCRFDRGRISAPWFPCI